MQRPAFGFHKTSRCTRMAIAGKLNGNHDGIRVILVFGRITSNATF